MIAAGELEIQRKLTKAFVEADVLSLTFSRAVKTPNGAGGQTTTRVAVAAQAFRMNPLQDATASRLTADGKQVSPQYMLVGEYDRDVRRGDQFTIGGRRYEVVFVIENRQYQVKAEVYYLGD